MNEPHFGHGGRSISGGFDAAILDKGRSLIPTLTHRFSEWLVNTELLQICDALWRSQFASKHDSGRVTFAAVLREWLQLAALPVIG
jgi:hypothetical protein